MTMEFKRNGISGAPIEIRPFAEFKQDKAISERRIRINEIGMASRRIADENPTQAKWFCIQVMSGRETAVEKTLEEEGVEGLVLREPEEIIVRRGRKWTCPGRPWLSGFVLVRCVYSPAAVRGILGLRHVIDIVGGWATPYRVPLEAINKFNEMMQEKEDDRERKRLEQEAKNAGIKAGDKVRIKLGPFSGFEAKVIKIGKGREKRCKVQYRLFGREGEVDIPLANLEAL